MIRCVPARLLLAAALQLAACPLARAESAAPADVRVTVAPVVKERMSGVAWRAMTAECNRIWAAEGIALEWSDRATGARLVLPLTFDDGEVRKLDSRRDNALGITLFAGRSRRIVVSVARAREVIALRRGIADSDDAMTLDIAMGVLLGRVVAHEIGHALLLTTSHSIHGLMRAQFDAHDLRPSLQGQFALSPSDRDRLAVRFSNEPIPAQLALADVTWMDVPTAPSLPRAPR
jgi:hypothetical protein